MKFGPLRKDKTKRKEKTTKEIQEAAPSETVKPPVTPKTVEPPIEEKLPVAERLRAIREKEVRYKLKAAVEDDDGARDIVTKILEQPMGVTIGELLGISKSTRELIKNEITQKRVPIAEIKKTSVKEVPDEDEMPRANRPPCI